MSTPKSAAGVPPIAKLREELGYGDAKSARSESFIDDARVFRKTFITAQGEPASSFYEWKSKLHHQGLEEMVDAYLKTKGKGKAFWPDNKDSYYYTKLQYSVHPQTIKYLLKQLFFRLNLQQYRNLKYKNRKQASKEEEDSTMSAVSGCGGSSTDPIDLDAMDDVNSSTVTSPTTSFSSPFLFHRFQAKMEPVDSTASVLSDTIAAANPKRQSVDAYDVPSSPPAPPLASRSTFRVNLKVSPEGLRATNAANVQTEERPAKRTRTTSRPSASKVFSDIHPESPNSFKTTHMAVRGGKRSTWVKRSARQSKPVNSNGYASKEAIEEATKSVSPEPVRRSKSAAHTQADCTESAPSSSSGATQLPVLGLKPTSPLTAPNMIPVEELERQQIAPLANMEVLPPDTMPGVSSSPELAASVAPVPEMGRRMSAISADPGPSAALSRTLYSLVGNMIVQDSAECPEDTLRVPPGHSTKENSVADTDRMAMQQHAGKDTETKQQTSSVEEENGIDTLLDGSDTLHASQDAGDSARSTPAVAPVMRHDAPIPTCSESIPKETDAHQGLISGPSDISNRPTTATAAMVPDAITPMPSPFLNRSEMEVPKSDTPKSSPNPDSIMDDAPKTDTHKLNSSNGDENHTNNTKLDTPNMDTFNADDLKGGASKLESPLPGTPTPTPTPSTHQGASGKPTIEFTYELITSRSPIVESKQWRPEGRFMDKTLGQVEAEIPLDLGPDVKSLLFTLSGPLLRKPYVVHRGQDTVFEGMKLKFAKSIRSCLPRMMAAGTPLIFDLEIEALRDEVQDIMNEDFMGELDF